MTAPLGFLQVDVDGLWAVRQCYARPEKDTFENDPCWHEGVVRLDGIFRKLGLPAGFFVVGRDVTVDGKRRILRKLVYRGYEIGNHSYTHRLGLTLEPVGFIEKEIRRTDSLLRHAGADPVGFRAPGYDVDSRVLRVVRQCGYLYDASLLPTYLGPLMRLADAWLARRWQSDKHQFGRFAYGRAPRRPYFPRPHAMRKPLSRPEAPALVEIPVGTTPRLRLPLTASTLLPMSRKALRDLFIQLADKRRPVLLLLHAIDGVDCSSPIVFDNRRPSLAGFAMDGETKERRITRIIEEFARCFHVMRADEFVRRYREEAP